MPADFTVTSGDLVASGDLVRLQQLPEPGFTFRGTPVNLGSRTLWRTLSPDARRARDRLGELLSQMVDTAEAGEPSEFLFITPPQEDLGNRPVWMRRNEQGGWTLMFPEDY